MKIGFHLRLSFYSGGKVNDALARAALVRSNPRLAQVRVRTSPQVNTQVDTAE